MTLLSKQSPKANLARALRVLAEAQRTHAEALETVAEVFLEEEGKEPCSVAEADRAALVKVKRAAELLDMSESWVYHAIEQGRLKCVRLGSQRRIRLKDLEAFIEARCSDGDPRALARQVRRGPSLLAVNGYDGGSQASEEEQEVPLK